VRPEPSSVSPQVTISSLRRGDAVTLPLLDAYRVYHVVSNQSVDGMRELCVRCEDGTRTVRLQGNDVAIRHDHIVDRTVPGHGMVAENESSEATGIVLGPPPVPQRVDFPYEGTIRFQGIVIYVENAIGSTRSGVDPDGKPWSVTMSAHYGEIPGTVAADGDPLDVYVGPDQNADKAYVIQTQIPGTKKFDEVKVMLGFPSRSAAVRAFYAHYTKPGFMQGITTWPMQDFIRSLGQPRVLRGKMDDSPQ
jgi:hypothetical protein